VEVFYRKTLLLVKVKKRRLSEKYKKHLSALDISFLRLHFMVWQ
jgi:hypothetical protein